jgi:endonuclease G
LVLMNRVARMSGGEIPLQILLRNAARRLSMQQLPEAEVFERAVSRVTNAAAGVRDLPDPAQLPEVIRNERIVGFDDTLDIGFLSAAQQVAKAVALISVPRFENGQQIMAGNGPWVSRGTAWLIAPTLALTNHHVVNARTDKEPDAGEQDLRRQAAEAMLRFDYDAKDTPAVIVRVQRLVRASTALDYALLELAEAVDRPVPQLAPEPVTVDATSRIAVNIVQHPRGEHKHIAFRNNLVSGADERILRYFTDTDQGSSGSPVCDDAWRVVGLHRGARDAHGVQFQGKREAFVNFGSQIVAILDDIRAGDPDAYKLITSTDR